jgi:hypothetical protein
MNRKWFCGVLVAAVIASLSGCGKSEKATSTSGADVQVIDATKLRPAFETAGADLKSLVNDTMMAIQGSDLVKALRNLDQLAANPAITADQKKVVTDLIEQLKKKLASTAPAAPQ